MLMKGRETGKIEKSWVNVSGNEWELIIKQHNKYTKNILKKN